MRSTITYLLVFIILFCALDYVFGKFMEKSFSELTFGIYGKINKSLGAKQEILIFGSSRAEHHYDPDVISKNTGMSCYNTGTGGYGVLYNYALFSEIVKNHKPNIVLLDLSPNVIVDLTTYSKLNIFMPYFHDYPSFNEIVRLDPDFSSFKTGFKFYVYNSTFYDYFRNRFFNKTQNNGFKGLNNKLNTKLYQPMQLLPSTPVDSIKMTYLKKFISISIKNNIRLICVVSPTYEKFDMDNRIISELEKIALENNIEFYDYSDFDWLYKNADFFKDQLHMNSKGAEIFSKDIAKIINHPSLREN